MQTPKLEVCQSGVRRYSRSPKCKFCNFWGFTTQKDCNCGLSWA